jgi:hypothetical protein
MARLSAGGGTTGRSKPKSSPANPFAFGSQGAATRQLTTRPKQQPTKGQRGANPLQSVSQFANAVGKVGSTVRNPQAQREGRALSDFYSSPIVRREIGRIFDSTVAQGAGAKGDPNKTFDLVRFAINKRYTPQGQVLLKHIWGTIPEGATGKFDTEKAAKAAYEYLPEGYSVHQNSVLDIPDQAIEGLGKFGHAIAKSPVGKAVSSAGETITKGALSPVFAPHVSQLPGGQSKTVATAGVGLSPDQEKSVAKSAGKTLSNLPGSALAFPAMAVLGPASMAKRAADQKSVGAALASPFKDIGNAYKNLAEHPTKSFEEDPVGATLMAIAPVAGLDRAAGMAARSPLAPRAVRSYASTARTPEYLGRVVSEDGNIVTPGIAVPRHAPKGLVANRVVKASDKRRRPTADQVMNTLEPKDVPKTATEIRNELTREQVRGPEQDIKAIQKSIARNELKKFKRTGELPNFDRLGAPRDPNAVGTPLPRVNREAEMVTYTDANGRIRMEPVSNPDLIPETNAQMSRRAYTIKVKDKPTRLENQGEMLARAEKIADAKMGNTPRRAPLEGRFHMGEDGKLKRIADEQADVTEVLRREMQKEAPNQTRLLAPYGNTRLLQVWGKPFGKKANAANDLVAEAVAKSVLPSTKAAPQRFRNTLQGRLMDLQDAQHGMGGVDKKYSNHLIKSIKTLLALSDSELAQVESRLFKSADEIARKKNEADSLIISRGLGLSADQAEARRLMPYALRHMDGAEFDRTTSSFVRNGEPLSVEAIRADMRRNGVDPDTVGYVNTQQLTEGSKNFYTPWRGNRGSMKSGRFTGKTFQRGAYPSRFENLVEQSARDAGLVARAKAHDKFISDYGIKKDLGNGQTRFYTGAEAKVAAAEMSEASGVEYQAIRAYPSSAQRGLVEQFQNPKTSVDSTALMSDWNRERFKEPTGDESSVVVPKELISRTQAQANVGSSLLSPVGGAFRRTVLALHTTWMTGNIIEAGLRSLVTGVHPGHYRVGKKLLNEIRLHDEEAAARLEARAIGGTMFGTQIRNTNRTQLGVALRRTPVLGQAVTGLEAFTDGIFALNRELERQFQIASLGKYAQREMQEFTDSWVQANRATTELFKDMARGYLDEGKQIEAARYVDECLGKYSKFSPKMRKAIQGYAIFLPWALNAVRFFTFTLPVKHPVQAGLLIASERMIDQDTKDAADSQPGTLRSEIPVDGGVRQVARYTPAGLFAGAAKWKDEGGYDAVYNVLGTAAAKQVLPEVSSQLALLAYGVNWKGKKAMDQNGNPIGNRPAYAIYSFAEALIPFLQMIRSYREHGGTPYDTSTAFKFPFGPYPGPQVKPGTKKDKSALSTFANKQNPFRVIETGNRGGGSGILSGSSGGSSSSGILSGGSSKSSGGILSGQ